MLLSYGAFLFFVLNQPSPGVDNRKKEPPGGGSFGCMPVGTVVQYPRHTLKGVFLCWISLKYWVR